MDTAAKNDRHTMEKDNLFTEDNNNNNAWDLNIKKISPSVSVIASYRDTVRILTMKRWNSAVKLIRFFKS